MNNNYQRVTNLTSIIRALAFTLLLLAGLASRARADAYLVKDINAAQETTGSSPTFFVSIGTDLFYFRADDGVNGTELWRSDGTLEGTALVADIAAGGANADPASLINVDGTLFFTAITSAHGRELWKSDGTAAGT